jgi:hypothetical protein
MYVSGDHGMTFHPVSTTVFVHNDINSRICTKTIHPAVYHEHPFYWAEKKHINDHNDRI